MSPAPGYAPDSRSSAADGTVVFSRQEADSTGVAPARAGLRSRHDAHRRSRRQPAPGQGEPGQVVYMFRRKGEEGGDDIRSVSLFRAVGVRVLGRGGNPVVAAGSLLPPGGLPAIRRRTLDGRVEDVLFEAPPSVLFDNLAVSPDAHWLATSETGIDQRLATPLCTAALGEEHRGPRLRLRGDDDVATAELFASGRAVYFARGDWIVRFDLATRAAASVPATLTPTSLAIAPDGLSLVLSTCRVTHDGVRLELDGQLAPLPALASAVGLLSVGPNGELAFPVAHEQRPPSASPIRPAPACGLPRARSTS